MLQNISKYITRHPDKTNLILIILTFLVGMGYTVILGDLLRFPDEFEYVAIATNLKNILSFSIDGLAPTSFRAPGLPFLFFLVSKISDTIIAYRILNFTLFSATIFLSFKILSEKISQRTALLSGMLIAGYPVMIYTAGTLYPQILASFLLLLFIYFIIEKDPTRTKFFLAGGTMGFLILTVPIFIYLIPVVGFWYLLKRRNLFYSFILYCTIPALILTGLWTYRNYLVFDSFVFVTSNTGKNLLLGNSENTTPNAGTTADISEYEAIAVNMDEISQDEYFRKSAIEYIQNNPTRTGQLYIQKLFNFFNYRNSLTTTSEASSIRDLTMLATYGPLLGLLIVRLILTRQFPITGFESLLLMIYAGGPLVYAVFFTRIRFRIPFDYIHILILVIFFDRVFKSWGSKKTDLT